MKVAVVLMVKDEAAEILAWLGWYFTLGVDTVIVYDDGSTDGTAELLAQASVAADVRLTRLAPTNESYVPRQHRTYQEAIRRHAEEFDWIGFFDADEYLALHAHQDIHAFLERPSDVGSVSINWCNYGSGGHVFRPTEFPFVAYREHFHVSIAINRITKSFLRPKLWTEKWHNVHFFDTGHRSVGPSGRDIVWTREKAIIASEPDWSIAKVMHYQCRSMEHFLDRMRKRDDLVANTRAWTEYDRGTEQDDRPLTRERVVRDWVVSTLLTVPLALPGALRGNATPIVEPPAPPVDVTHPAATHAGPSSLARLRAALGLIGPRPQAPHLVHASETLTTDVATVDDRVSVFLPLAFEGRRLAQDPENGRLRVSNVDQDGPDTIYVIQPPASAGRVFLLRLAGPEAPLLAAPDGRLTAALGLDVVEQGDARCALRHPHTKRYLCAVPPHAGGVAVLDRRFVKEWETFTLRPIGRPQSGADQPVIAFLDDLAMSPDRAAFLRAALTSDKARLAMALLPVWLDMLDLPTSARVRSSLGQGFCSMVT